MRESFEGLVPCIEINGVIVVELAPFGGPVSFPGSADAGGPFLGALDGAHDAGLVKGDDAISLVDEFLIHRELLVSEIGQVEVLDQEVRLIELFPGRELKGFSDGNARDGFEQGNKHFLNADVIVLAPAMVFGSVEPEDVDVPAEFFVLKLAGDFEDLAFWKRFIGL